MSDEENIIDINPSATFYYERAFDAYHKNQIDKGIKYFKRGISLADLSYEKYYGQVQLALMYQHGGRFNDSYELLGDLIDQSGQMEHDLYYFQAVNCSYLNYFDESKELLEDFIDLLDKKKIKQNPYRKEAEEMIEFLNGQNKHWF